MKSQSGEIRLRRVLDGFNFTETVRFRFHQRHRSLISPFTQVKDFTLLFSNSEKRFCHNQKQLLFSTKSVLTDGINLAWQVKSQSGEIRLRRVLDGFNFTETVRFRFHQRHWSLIAPFTQVKDFTLLFSNSEKRVCHKQKQLLFSTKSVLTDGINLP